MKKIIYLVLHPYTKRDHHRYGSEYFTTKGYDVEIWRIVDNHSIDYEATAGMYRNDNYHVYNKTEFRKKIKEYKGAAYILLGGGGHKCLNYVAHAGCDYILINGVCGVVRPSNEEVKHSFLEHVDNWRKKGLIRGVYVKYNQLFKYPRVKSNYKKLLKQNPPKLILTSTRYMAEKSLMPEELALNVKYLHCMDYDRAIEADRSGGERQKKYIVYCDAAMANVDYDLLLENGQGIDTLKYKDLYYRQCETLFKKLEEHYQLPVVVTGHPHTIYNKGDFFGREIVFDKTCELTRDAAVFIVNSSTAFNFAEIYDVPTLKIANHTFKIVKTIWPNYYDFMKWEAEETGVGFLDMDDVEAMEHPWDYVKEIDAKKRADFLNKYIVENEKPDKKTIYEVLEEYVSTELM